jgi:hypothetical protein
MARPGSHSPHGLDQQIESSLRRQFAVPAVGLLPSAMVAGAATAGSGSAAASGGGLRLDFSVSFSLRQAAGLALAASLWMGAGYLFFEHFGTRQSTASVSYGRYGVGIAPGSPLDQLLSTYDAAREDPRRDADAQDELWSRLQDEMAKRRGEAIIPHLQQLRNSDEPIELVVVDGEKFSDEGSLLVSARVNNVIATALIDSTGAGKDPYVAMPGVVEVPTTEANAPQLFLTKFPNGQAYEVVAASAPMLMPLLVPESEIGSALPLERGRNRSMHAVAAPPPLE